MNQFKIAVLEVEIISLESRSKKCRDFCMNQNLSIEADIVDKQIEALKKELEIEKRKND